MEERPDSTNLNSPPLPVSLVEPSLTKGETTITLRCQDNLFKNCTVTGEAGETLFTVHSPGLMSYHWRRAVKDASGRQIFELRRHYFLGAAMLATSWILDAPTGETICTVRHNKSLLNPKHSSLNMSIRNTANGNKETLVEIRQGDWRAKKTLVKIDGATVADIIALENNDLTSFITGGVRSIWKARVASGVDLKVILVAMLCRAEQRHLWLL